MVLEDETKNNKKVDFSLYTNQWDCLLNVPFLGIIISIININYFQNYLLPQKNILYGVTANSLYLFSTLVGDSIAQEKNSPFGSGEIEQKGCKKRSRGTKYQLIIDKTVLKDCRNRETNLTMAWIDYKNAYGLCNAWT